MEHRFDSIILSRTGLSEEEAKSFIEKHQAFLGSLSGGHIDAVKNSHPSWEEAAKSIDPSMTAADLQDFVQRRGGNADLMGLFLNYTWLNESGR